MWLPAGLERPRDRRAGSFHRPAHCTTSFMHQNSSDHKDRLDAHVSSVSSSARVRSMNFLASWNSFLCTARIARKNSPSLLPSSSAVRYCAECTKSGGGGLRHLRDACTCGMVSHWPRFQAAEAARGATSRRTYSVDALFSVRLHNSWHSCGQTSRWEMHRVEFVHIMRVQNEIRRFNAPVRDDPIHRARADTACDPARTRPNPEPGTSELRNKSGEGATLSLQHVK